MTTILKFTLLLVPFLLMSCASPQTRIVLKEPVSAKLSFEGKTYDFSKSSAIVLSRPSQKGEQNQVKVRMELVHNGSVLKAHGILFVFAYDETDEDKFALNFLEISPSQIEKLKNGSAIIIEGYSASKHKVYKLLLGKEV